jgi:hypothetical protein
MVTIPGPIVGGTIQRVIADSIHITGLIDQNSLVVLVSTVGSIIVDGRIDGNSNLSLKAPLGNVTIGAAGERIDGSSHVEAVAGGNISLGGRIDGSATVDFSAHGGIVVSDKIDGSATARFLADGDIALSGKIDGSSAVEAVSNRGSVIIGGKIDGSSNAYLTAGMDVSIGHDKGLNPDDRKIDGNCFVTAIAGGNISVGGEVHKDHTSVDLAAAGSITIANDIGAGATARLLSGTGTITVSGGIDSSSTVTFWPVGALTASPTVTAFEWADPGSLALTAARGGYWWENWGQTFGYVAPFRVVPRSLDEIGAAIVGTANRMKPDLTPVKAIGGGWSFTDAALPFPTLDEVNQASIQVRGAWQQQDLRNVLEGQTDQTFVQPMDLLPSAIARNRSFSTSYNQTDLRQVTNSGEQLPASGKVRLIDTRFLASSLQCEFPRIRAAARRRRRHPEILFHVEAGITMSDLQHLLDHQHPRLALQATGGSPGATLAGALSTATHGGEFNVPLLVDQVRAVHLVGPGGEQWWIEGDVPVADQAKLQKRYHKIDPAHFIGGSWSGIPGLTAQDVLKAVVVSMGTMGVIYSMVLAVKPQFGVRQVVHPTSWLDVLTAAKVTENDLRAGNTAANQAVLNVLMDGTLNGSGIAAKNNIYIDLAMNPINLDCWVVNREITHIPDDANNPSVGIGDFTTALSRALNAGAVDQVQHSMFAGRIFDFLSYATDVPGINLVDDINDASAAGRLMDFVTKQADVLGGVLAAVNSQAVLNVINASSHPDRGHEFLGDVLTGFFHALEGTAVEMNSDLTGVSYKVGAVGWPDTGIPGRGLEIALDETNAFTFLQTVLLDDVLAKTMTALNNPLVGYISIRICPPTETLMGMQQYSPHSVMIEVVSYRSPQANRVMGEIQSKAIAWSGSPKPLLHWGLENDQVSGAYLATTPLGQPYKGVFTRIDAFRQIRDYLRNGNVQVFDNNFTNRVGL